MKSDKRFELRITFLEKSDLLDFIELNKPDFTKKRGKMRKGTGANFCREFSTKEVEVFETNYNHLED